jgi:hypothetical protein
MCTCGQEPQTAEHILQDCCEYDILRQTQWPIETLENKLYGPLYELQKTEVYTGDNTEIDNILCKRNINRTWPNDFFILYKGSL